jgi:hypothetical protein
MDDPVSKLEHMGRETIKKLQDLRAAASQVGVGSLKEAPLFEDASVIGHCQHSVVAPAGPWCLRCLIPCPHAAQQAAATVHIGLRSLMMTRWSLGCCWLPVGWCLQVGVEMELGELNNIEKVSQFKALALKAEQDATLKQKVKHTPAPFQLCPLLCHLGLGPHMHSLAAWSKQPHPPATGHGLTAPANSSSIWPTSC